MESGSLKGSKIAQSSFSRGFTENAMTAGKYRLDRLSFKVSFHQNGLELGRHNGHYITDNELWSPFVITKPRRCSYIPLQSTNQAKSNSQEHFYR
ncbi:unnamed protein product [Hermetia illucens]|uniref:Uncharacterized protein n=1 Tax=Hermetia illucens TaxID=343691 RepID=A0A7R8UYX6_HERIL|nr:unnamed protein product [Hermetia illucens]